MSCDAREYCMYAKLCVFMRWSWQDAEWQMDGWMDEDGDASCCLLFARLRLTSDTYHKRQCRISSKPAMHHSYA